MNVMRKTLAALTILAGFGALNPVSAAVVITSTEPGVLSNGGPEVTFNNLAIGITSLMILRINRNLLPPQLQPRWYHQAGIFCCGVFYIGMFFLVLIAKFGLMAQKWVSSS